MERVREGVEELPNMVVRTIKGGSDVTLELEAKSTKSVLDIIRGKGDSFTG